MIAVKFGRGLYTKPWPRSVVVSWGVAGSAFVVVLFAWQLRIWLGSSSRSTSSNAGGRGSGAGVDAYPAAKKSFSRRKPLPEKQL